MGEIWESPLRLQEIATADLPAASAWRGGLVFDGTTLGVKQSNGTVWAAVGGSGGVTDGDKGDITVSGVGTVWTIDAGAVTLAKQANVATSSIMGRVTAATGVQEALTGTQATTLLDAFTSALKGLAPASGGGTSNFLRADGTWAAPAAGGISDGDKGDITVSSSGTVWTVDAGAITLAKQADMATASVVYRKTAGAGAPEVQTLATLKTDLGLTGTNSGDQTITLTGDVTGSGTGSFAATVGNGTITLAKMADIATARFIGRVTAATGVPEALTGTQATTLLDAFTTGLKGLAPASGGGTSNFLRADGTWAAPTGGGGGLTNWTEGVNTSAPNATVPVVYFTATNAATDVDAAILTKGTGALLAAVPDATSAGGDKRGTYAVDWQRQRGAATEVASGVAAVISGGMANTASGDYSVVAGGGGDAGNLIYGNTASGDYSFVGGGYSNLAASSNTAVVGGSGNIASSSDSFVGGGYGNTASGSSSFAGAGSLNNASGLYSVIGGGYGNIASGWYSAIVGGYAATTRGLQSAEAFAAGSFAATGDAQRGLYVARGSTTTATPLVLTFDAGAAGTTNQVVLPNDATYIFRVSLVARRTDADNESAAYTFEGCIDRNANAASTALVGTPVKTILAEDTTAWDVAVSADTTNGALAITVTGQAAKTIRWVAKIETVEVVG
jgi:hypothetical protein